VSATVLPVCAVASAVNMASLAFIAIAFVSIWRAVGVAVLGAFQAAAVAWMGVTTVSCPCREAAR
jgi:hypothetical protein